MTVETTDTRNVCVRGEFVAKIQVCLQTFKFFSFPNINILCLFRLCCALLGSAPQASVVSLIESIFD